MQGSSTFHDAKLALQPKGSLTGFRQGVFVVHQQAWNNRQQGPLLLQVSMSRRVSCFYFEIAKHSNLCTICTV
jgi:hypothetical protein